jgi:hypothetical protein
MVHAISLVVRLPLTAPALTPDALISWLRALETGVAGG